MMNGAAHSGAGVRKPPREETAGGDEVARQKLWGFRRADVRYCVPGKADIVLSAFSDVANMGIGRTLPGVVI